MDVSAFRFLNQDTVFGTCQGLKGPVQFSVRCECPVSRTCQIIRHRGESSGVDDWEEELSLLTQSSGIFYFGIREHVAVCDIVEI